MLFAGIDLGTSGCRIIVIDRLGNIQYQDHVIYESAISQTPDLWWQSVSQLLKQLPTSIAQYLTSICVDGTSGTLLLTDEHGTPTTPALMYNDTRAIAESEEIKQYAPDNSGAHGAGSSLSKLLFLLKKKPNVNHKHALHQADWISNKLLGKFGLSDENNCLKLGFDSVLQNWPDWIDKLGFPLSLLPKVKPSGSIFGTLSDQVSKQFNLPKNISVIAGTTDSIAAFIATRSSKIGDAVSSLGSTLAIKMVCEAPIFSAKMGVYSHRFGKMWLVGGASNTGGACLKQHFSSQQMQEMEPQLNSEKMLNLGYYPLPQVGERFPIANPKKQAKLSPRPPSDTDFFQAMLEGIADIEAKSYNVLKSLGAPSPTTIYTVGGGSKNTEWAKIRRKKIAAKIEKPRQTEAAYGAALLGIH